MWKVYSVFDVKAQEYGQLYLARTDNVAARMFADGVRDGGSILAQHPEDFGLECVGSFDETTGELLQDGSGASVISGLEVVRALALVKEEGKRGVA